MKFLFQFAFATALAALPVETLAQEIDASRNPASILTEADSLDRFKWVARPVIVFADSPNDPRFVEQIGLLHERSDALFDRDVVIIADTNPDTPTDIRKKLRPRGFSLVLVGKDGEIELRKPIPWAVRELTHVIDKMPLRQQEIRDANRAPGPS